MKSGEKFVENVFIEIKKNSFNVNRKAPISLRPPKILWVATCKRIIPFKIHYNILNRYAIERPNKPAASKDKKASEAKPHVKKEETKKLVHLLSNFKKSNLL